jgi:hypothetical protein
LLKSKARTSTASGTILDKDCSADSSLGLRESNFKRIRRQEVMSTRRAGFFHRDSGMLIDGAAWRFRRQ